MANEQLSTSFTPLLPDQRVSRSEKTDRKFYKNTYDNLIPRAMSLNDKTLVATWLEAANGKINDKSIQYLVTPFINDDKSNIGSLPGEIRDTDMINTIRERNLGEYIGLPYKYEVVVHNEDAVTLRDNRVKREVNALIQQAVINELNALYEKQQQEGGVEALNINTPTEEIPEIKEKIDKVIAEYFDDRAILGQSILDLINDVNDFDTKRLQAFFYWWATEEFYTYREVVNGEVKTSIISPLDGYPIIGDEQFIEDGDAFVIKRRITFTELKSKYWDKLPATDKEYINSLTKTKQGYTASPNFLRSRSLSSSERAFYTQNQNSTFNVINSDELVDEYTVIWRTEVPVKIRTYTDQLDETYEEIVEEGYQSIDPTETIREEWVEEVWVGKRFGDATTGVYLEPEPCVVQRYDRHTNRCKLPTGGKKGILQGIAQNPIPNRLIPFEIIDRILTLQIERTIAKYRDALLVIPQSIVNSDQSGTTKEKFFYMKADNQLLYDDSNVDLQTAIQGLRSLNFPAGSDFLKTLVELRQQYKQEGLEKANMNNYRLGDIMPSAGKGVVQEGIYRAAVGNVLAVTMFNAALQRDHNADLEFAKVAYANGKKTSYYSKQQRKVVYIDIDPFKLLDSDMGAIVHNAKLDADKIEAYRNFAFSAAQNGEFGLAAAAIESDTLPEIRRAVDKIVEANRKFEEQLNREQAEATRYAADMADKVNQEKMENDKLISFAHDTAAITVATINANSKESGATGSQTVINPSSNNYLDQYFKDREFLLKQQKQIADDRNKKEELKLKNKQIDSAEKIAKMNKNRFDKKK